MDVSANQNEVTAEHETFQFRYNQATDTWNIITKEGNFWSLGAAATIHAANKDAKAGGHFKLRWNPEDGTCSLLAMSDPKSSDQKWICSKKSGQLVTAGSEPVRFYVKLQNRTTINLRGANASGFVGLKVPGQYFNGGCIFPKNFLNFPFKISRSWKVGLQQNNARFDIDRIRQFGRSDGQ